MLFSNDRQDLRQVFFNSWKKHENSMHLEPMEQIILNVLKEHPEYHSFFSNPDNIDKDFLPESGQVNPFLHLSMHIAIHEQLTINQPIGIGDLYNQLREKIQDAHETEHLMMDCLGEMIWSAQRENRAPNEKDYFSCLKKIIQK